ncbi:MAG: GNAT family N-acetyltransferase [Lachnospiraceae bacterium]|nr:GNAT family N-acetyltransferase [Lachnospiraceae bacterium]
MKTMGLVRLAQDKDIPAIMRLLVQVNMVHHNGRPDIFKGPTTKYDEAELKEIIACDNNPVFVFEDDNGNVLGHAFCVHKQERGSNLLTDIKTLYIDDICVDEDARGKHVGCHLFEAVTEYARREGFYNITLNVWSCNPDAIKFYEAMGLIPQKIGMEMIL